ncbi:unnamed protein product [Colias eurytheme]|nr:unnamed protein product [Colias eurytheme]CAG4992936.1 unnamed protein product [Colias eurytheme]
MTTLCSMQSNQAWTALEVIARSRSKDEAPKPPKPGAGMLSTRIGYGDGPDPNQYWKFGEDANPRGMST